ncbi:MAG: DinB family protein [Pirellulales bacterium]|nr:DinB family protein [Pirellulales bacterium]
MDTKAALRTAIDQGEFIVQGYLGDLTDADLLVRAAPGTNHIAWQLGHLIVAENMMVDGAYPGSMPKLPPGFVEQHSKETAGSDDAQKFCKKSEYLSLMQAQRAGTLKALAATSDADFDKPAPEAFRSFLSSIGALFAMQGTHWVMHAGQWAIIRRKLGKPPLF